MPQIQEQIIDVIKVLPEGWMSRSWMCQCRRSWRKSLRLSLTGVRRQHGWTCIFGPGQIVDVPVPQVMEETVEAAMLLVVLPARRTVPGRGENGRSPRRAQPVAAALFDDAAWTSLLQVSGV